MKYKRLGEMLVDVGVITEEQLSKALAMQKGSGCGCSSVLISLTLIRQRSIRRW